MKKTSFYLVCAMLLILILAGCGKPAEKKEEKPAITLWHNWDTEGDGNAIAFRQVLEDFKKDNPDNNVTITGFSSAQYDTKVKVSLAANEAADIIALQGPGELDPYVANNKLFAMDDLIAKYGIADKVLSGTFNNFTFNNKVYGLPTITAIAILYCNDELFKKYNVPYPETFTQLLQAIDLFNKNGVTPMLFAGKDKWPLMFYYDILAIRIGGAKKSEDALFNRASFEEPEFVEAARKLQELVKAKAFKETDLSLGWDEGVQKFAQGSVAMFYNGTWVTGIINQPEMPVKGKIALKKFPMVEGGKGDINEFFGGAFECFSINALSKAPEEAFKVVSYISEHMSNTSLKLGNGLPAWKNANLDRSNLDPIIAEQYDLISDAKGFCLWWDTVLGGQKADIHKDLVLQLLTNKISPENYAVEMQKLNKN
jgi:raffinose/stachyose/melibiose transport system substrate-binding protein